MRLAVVIIAVLVILLGGAYFFMLRSTPEKKMPVSIMTERITLKTSDNVILVGDYAGKPGQPAVLMLHMMPSTRESWRAFSEKLNAVGFQTLAIDMRGHGESQGGPNGYKRFSDEEHQSSIHDVRAGIAFLKSKNPSKIFIAGASIGANLALWYAAEDHDTASIILLSPGLDYRGIRTEPFVSKLSPSQRVYYAAGRDDTYSADTVEALHAATPSSIKKELRIFERAGHGTTIFEKEPSFMDELAVWLRGSD